MYRPLPNKNPINFEYSNCLYTSKSYETKTNTLEPVKLLCLCVSFSVTTITQPPPNHHSTISTHGWQATVSLSSSPLCLSHGCLRSEAREKVPHSLPIETTFLSIFLSPGWFAGLLCFVLRQLGFLPQILFRWCIRTGFKQILRFLVWKWSKLVLSGYDRD